jgi:hypothetical protein
MRKTLFVLGVLSLVLVNRPLRAHHILEAQYDVKHPVHLTGTVTSMEWVNPHSWIHLDVKGPDGNVTGWRIACGGLGFLRHSGLNEKLLAAGTEISVDGYLARNASNVADGTNVTFKDGRKLPLSGPVFRDGKAVFSKSNR